MNETITGTGSLEWRIRICRPLPRYYARSELSRQLHKLRWWNADEPLVIDLQWNSIARTELVALFVDPSGEVPGGVRNLFFEHSPDPAVPTLWVLGG